VVHLVGPGPIEWLGVLVDHDRDVAGVGLRLGGPDDRERAHERNQVRGLHDDLLWGTMATRPPRLRAPPSCPAARASTALQRTEQRCSEAADSTPRPRGLRAPSPSCTGS